jgi:hypothetical protein
MSHLLVYLRVVDADSEDYGRLVVRIHEDDKPKQIKWGQYIGISLDEKHWVTSKVEPSGLTGKGKIYIHHLLRSTLNRDTTGNRTAAMGTPCYFYIRRAPSWKEPFYIMRHHPDSRARTQARLKLYWALVKTAVVIVECGLVATYSFY